jgi:hypothetical protein
MCVISERGAIARRFPEGCPKKVFPPDFGDFQTKYSKSGN